MARTKQTARKSTGGNPPNKRNNENPSPSTTSTTSEPVNKVDSSPSPPISSVLSSLSTTSTTSLPSSTLINTTATTVVSHKRKLNDDETPKINNTAVVENEVKEVVVKEEVPKAVSENKSLDVLEPKSSDASSSVVVIEKDVESNVETNAINNQELNEFEQKNKRRRENSMDKCCDDETKQISEPISEDIHNFTKTDLNDFTEEKEKDLNDFSKLEIQFLNNIGRDKLDMDVNLTRTAPVLKQMKEIQQKYCSFLEKEQLLNVEKEQQIAWFESEKQKYLQKWEEKHAKLISDKKAAEEDEKLKTLNENIIMYETVTTGTKQEIVENMEKEQTLARSKLQELFAKYKQ